MIRVANLALSAGTTRGVEEWHETDVAVARTHAHTHTQHGPRAVLLTAANDSTNGKQAAGVTVTGELFVHRAIRGTD
jgi:hypothetical protein